MRPERQAYENRACLFGCPGLPGFWKRNQTDDFVRYLSKTEKQEIRYTGIAY